MQDQTARCVAGERRRYAIIGGGFAGVATAWHLLAHASSPVSIHLFDGAGIAGGASGAAAGLLHPYSPKGKVSYFCSDSTDYMHSAHAKNLDHLALGFSM